MATLQQQGVPIRPSLRGPEYVGRHAKGNTGRHRARQSSGPRSTQSADPTGSGNSSSTGTGNRRVNPGDVSPTRLGDKAGSVGLLEAEFLGSLVLLVMLMFASTSTTYADKVMSIMKRGTLVCLYFFILALLAAIGPNMAKVANALGGLALVTILLTAPAQSAITDIDNLIKNDWVGTSEHGTDVGSADTGSSSSGSSGGGPLGAAEGAINRINQIIQNFGFGIIK